jgi:hypothetical protein
MCASDESIPQTLLLVNAYHGVMWSHRVKVDRSLLHSKGSFL